MKKKVQWYNFTNHRYPGLGQRLTLGEPVACQERICTRQHSVLYNPMWLGFKATAAPRPHNGERFKASALLFLQWPGWLCPRAGSQPVLWLFEVGESG